MLWVGQDKVSGTLRRSSTSTVKFPVLLNGKRIELNAIHAIGQMALGSAKRPFETVILDHPQYPLSLRIAYGSREGGFPFKPAFAREIVRIDFPEPQGGTGRVRIRGGAVLARARPQRDGSASGLPTRSIRTAASN
jgi:hypothetical protein